MRDVPVVSTIRSVALVLSVSVSVSVSSVSVASGADYPASDSLSPYVHWIALYDANNQKIDPEAEGAKPYSPLHTCGRCHDFDSISHGWHFNAVEADAKHGRPGQPWIWSDKRTGTFLPLSYRGWDGTWNPDELGLSRWQVAEHFGGYLPGGGPGALEAFAKSLAEDGEEAAEGETVEPPAGFEDRSNVTGPLPVDCMMCHRADGSGYSPFVWTEQIEEQNFAYAPTAALGIGVVKGSMKRLKDDFDPNDEANASKMPALTYETEPFRSDGKVFFDLIRKPSNNACYYCHSNVSDDSVVDSRWIHDEDIHVRAGVGCADCHRNGIGHHTVRGYEGEEHPSGNESLSSLSCRGCHMADTDGDELTRSGRLGSPQAMHKGLPPIHFEKMTCTACHSGTLPEQDVPRQLNSIIHHLGHHLRRTGEELPGVVGPALLRVDEDWDRYGGDGFDEATAKYAPHRMMWPSYWATVKESGATVLNPAAVYDVIRRPLKVRNDLNTELGTVRLSSTVLKELLGEDRYKAKPEERTEEEQAKVDAAEAEALAEQVSTRLAGALEALEKEYDAPQAAFVSGGQAFVRSEDDGLETVDPQALGLSAEASAWPLAHNVRSAQQSLGVTGCAECHSEKSLTFHASVTPVGVLPGQETTPIVLASLQGADLERLGLWDQLFAGRSTFKIAGLIALALTVVLVLAASVNQFRRRSDA